MTAAGADRDGDRHEDEDRDAEALRALALSNYGHFTTMLAGGAGGAGVRGLGLHLDRLEADCRELFGVSLDRAEVQRRLRGALDGVHRPVVLRVTVTDCSVGVASPLGSGTPHVVVTSRPAPAAPGRELRAQPVDSRRELPHVKHTGLFGTIRAVRAARASGFDDVVFAPAAVLAEGSAWNLALWDGAEFVWPDAAVLPGVAMRLLSARVPSRAEAVGVAALAEFPAAFATNAVSGVRPVGCIGDVAFPGSARAFTLLSEAWRDVPVELP